METDLYRFLWRRQLPEFQTISPAALLQTRLGKCGGPRCSQISFFRAIGGPSSSYPQTSMNREEAWRFLAARNPEDGKPTTLRMFRARECCLHHASVALKSRKEHREQELQP